MSQPKVSIIIVNYNGKGLTTDCLRTLQSQTSRDFELVIVDNGSSDDSLQEIRRFLEKSNLYSISNIVPLNNNRGFTGGNIEGMKHARGEFIALLNNDTEPEPVWLEELVKAMDTHPDVGICASKMIVYGSNCIDSAGDIYSTFLKGFKRGEGRGEDEYIMQEYVFGACAGAALYRRTMLEEIGFLDEDFFLIQEDTDLSFRAQLAGWRVLYVPTAVVHHKVRSTIGHMSDIASYYTLRNNELVRIKNVPTGILLRHAPELIVSAISEFLYFALKHGKLGVYVRAKRDAFGMLSAMRAKRKTIMMNRKASNGYIESIMTPIFNKEFLKAKLKKFIYG